MGGEDEYLGNLDMGRCVRGIDGHVGDIVARQGLDALIDISGTVVVAVEADIAEIGLYKSGLQVGNTDGGVSNYFLYFQIKKVHGD